MVISCEKDTTFGIGFPRRSGSMDCADDDGLVELEPDDDDEDIDVASE